MNFAFLNGAWLPGAGDEYTIHVQEPGFAQVSCRMGCRRLESRSNCDSERRVGRPGSDHYTDLTREWVAGRLEPLPFTRAAIRQNASSVLVLRPL